MAAFLNDLYASGAGYQIKDNVRRYTQFTGIMQSRWGYLKANLLWKSSRMSEDLEYEGEDVVPLAAW